ncbi:hypothetical protein DFQ26_007600 [Actinomortierella ambigua]|nr:hypothetical protein DFQ26_007600 [Actinomortierella ambigua]
METVVLGFKMEVYGTADHEDPHAQELAKPEGRNAFKAENVCHDKTHKVIVTNGAIGTCAQFAPRMPASTLPRVTNQKYLNDLTGFRGQSLDNFSFAPIFTLITHYGARSPSEELAAMAALVDNVLPPASPTDNAVMLAWWARIQEKVFRGSVFVFAVQTTAAHSDERVMVLNGIKSRSGRGFQGPHTISHKEASKESKEVVAQVLNPSQQVSRTAVYVDKRISVIEVFRFLLSVDPSKNTCEDSYKLFYKAVRN